MANSPWVPGLAEDSPVPAAFSLVFVVAITANASLPMLLKKVRVQWEITWLGLGFKLPYCTCLSIWIYQNKVKVGLKNFKISEPLVQTIQILPCMLLNVEG